MRSFVYATRPTRVVFGAGTVAELGDEVRALSGTRALVLAGPNRTAEVARIGAALGPLAAGDFTGAAEHTPVEVTERALAVLTEHKADCLVAVGGGSATGLAKALALRTDLPQVVLPTTYSGSEVTPVLGETEHGNKFTRSSPAVLPETVIYDVELTLGLPMSVSVTSAVNALAHAVEALYAPDANPVTDELAMAAIRGIATALPALPADPADVEIRAELLRCAWLAGTCLASVRMGLHHKLCHTLGGSFGLPHASTHTVLLPYAMAYNAPAAPAAFERIGAALGTTDPVGAVYDLVAGLALPGCPRSLADLGLAEADLPMAAALGVAQPYPNPREVTLGGVEALLADAWHGRRPAGTETTGQTEPAPQPSTQPSTQPATQPSTQGAEPAAEPTTERAAAPDFGWLTESVVESFGNAPTPRTRELFTGLVRHLHRFITEQDLTEDEWRYGIDFLTGTGAISSPTRQEFVLLSDTLGVSSIVDLLTNTRTPDTTPSAVLGPYYVDGPPEQPTGADLTGGLPGTPLFADIRITDQRDRPVPDAVVDVWQSNADGLYDVQLDAQEGPILRARFRTDDDGRFGFRSIVPVAYPIPDDGPVGQMLTMTGRHPYRAPHIHFMISAPGYQRLVTQLFVAGGDYLDSDAVFGVKPDLIVDFASHTGPTPDGGAGNGGWRSLAYTFRIARLAPDGRPERG